jgi:hypothetical protein
MLQHAQLDDAQVRRIEAALRPHAWQRMSLRAVALRLVEEIDGGRPAADDDRVWMVERSLSGCRWRGLTVAGLARQAAAALATWQASRRRLELELASLLDGG